MMRRITIRLPKGVQLNSGDEIEIQVELHEGHGSSVVRRTFARRRDGTEEELLGAVVDPVRNE